MQRAFKSTLVAGAMALMAGVAFASGGGGGGSSGGGASMPSASGPSYDPAAEYAKAIAAMKANNFKDAVRAAGHVTDAVPQNPDGWRLLGMAKIDERYAAPSLVKTRADLRAADRRLAAIQAALHDHRPDAGAAIDAWLAATPALERELAARRSASLFDPARLAQAAKRRLPG